VALTAGVLAEDRAACIRSGMNSYLSKPIRTDELAAALAVPRTARQAG
jgi:CheY-like chemotaxis protein